MDEIWTVRSKTEKYPWASKIPEKTLKKRRKTPKKRRYFDFIVDLSPIISVHTRLLRACTARSDKSEKIGEKSLIYPDFCLIFCRPFFPLQNLFEARRYPIFLRKIGQFRRFFLSLVATEFWNVATLFCSLPSVSLQFSIAT